MALKQGRNSLLTSQVTIKPKTNAMKQSCMANIPRLRIRLVAGVVVVIASITTGITSAQDGREGRLSHLMAECDRHYRAGHYEKAVLTGEEVVKLTQAKYGLNHSNTANWMNNVALMHYSLHNYEEAESLYVRSIEIKERILGDHPMTASSLNNLAILYTTQGRLDEAEPISIRALRIREQTLGQGHPDTAHSLNRVAELYEKQGRFDEAEHLLLKALNIYESKKMKDQVDNALVLGSLAELYYDLGKFDEAAPLYARALRIYETKLGEDHPSTATALNGAALNYQALGQFDAATSLFLRGLKIAESRFGVNHQATVTLLNNLALLYNHQGKIHDAERFLLRAEKIRGADLGTDFSDMSLLNNLADLYQSQGKYKKAEALYLRALKMSEKQLGEGHPRTSVLLRNLATVFRDQGKTQSAASMELRALKATHLHWTKMFRYFPEKDCLLMSRTLSTDYVAGNSLNGSVAATAQILFKNSVLEAMNLRRVANEQVRKTTMGRSLLAKQKKLESAYRKVSLAEGEASESKRTLEKDLDALSKEVALLANTEVLDTFVSVDLPLVQKNLKHNDILIEFFSYVHFVPKAAEIRYSSSLIRSKGEPIYLAHGSADRIENAIELYREAVLNTDGSLSDREHESDPDRKASLKSAEKELYSLLFGELEKSLQPGDSVIFSLDSQLHFVPLHMIRDEEGVPFGQKYRVRYVTSGRDLVKKRHNVETKTALLLGNPSFRNSSPLEAVSDAGGETDPLLVSTFRNGMKEDAGQVNLPPLPGTVREINRISEKLSEEGYQVRSLSGKSATEEALNQNIDGSRVVHLATHGFFLNEIEVPKQDKTLPMLSGETPRMNVHKIQDPMYRSGLALTGAQSTFNLWKSGKIPPPAKDGILMAAEANLLNLRRTDLVVLSACETAKGEALDGEGVMGLRRAFASAGANNTIMTLWPVDDESTVEVMDAFYDKYLSGTHPAVALSEVQNELYEPFVEKYGEVEAIARLAPFICMSIGKVSTSEVVPSLGHVSTSPPSNGENFSAGTSRSFTNSLGMKFVPVPGTNVLFCEHETRVKDYAVYASENPGVNMEWKKFEYKGHKQTGDHPVVDVSWEDPKDFCAWLSAKDGRQYRLPSDHEWSVAVGIADQENRNASPKDENNKIEGYPWGSAWPPPKGAGNFNGSESASTYGKISGYTDAHPVTAPVKSYLPNRGGVYDLSGNVWEWCEDWHSIDRKYRVLRGGSWIVSSELNLQSSHRRTYLPSHRLDYYGFRCVVDVEASQD